MDAKIRSFFESTRGLVGSGENIPWCDRDIIAVCEREVAEAENSGLEQLISHSSMRLSRALIHSRHPEDVQRGIAMLEVALSKPIKPNQREALYLRAVGHYRSGDYSSNDFDALTKAFSGFGVDESFIVSVSAKWRPYHLTIFRKSCSNFSRDDEHSFHRWEVAHIAKLKTEFSRFECSNGGRTRGRETLGSPAMLSTRARKAYQSIFDHSLEEDVASHLRGNSRALLLALLSAYRYEGPMVIPERAISDAKILGKAVKEPNAVHNDDVVRILSTKSKKQLKLTFDQYNEIFGSTIDKDLENDLILQSTVECLASPATYYSKVLAKALSKDADETAKKALTRVVVTRADVDSKEIKEEFNKIYGVSVAAKVAEVTSGNYKDFLLALIARDA